MYEIDNLPLILSIAWIISIGWHFAYVFAMILETVQEVQGHKKQFKVWDHDVEQAAQKMAEAAPEDRAAAEKEFISTLTRKEEPDVPWWGDIRRELWWIEVHVAFPILNFVWIVTINGPWDVVLAFLNILCNYWWWKHHDHDDRWKKRRKKALAKVKEVGGKLVVVPVPAGSAA